MEFRLLLGVAIVGLGETLVINHQPKYYPKVFQNIPHPGVRSHAATFRTYWPPVPNINSKHSASTASKIGEHDIASMSPSRSLNSGSNRISCHYCISKSEHDHMGYCLDTNGVDSSDFEFGNTHGALFVLSYRPNQCLLIKVQHETSNGSRTLVARMGILAGERSQFSNDTCLTKNDPINKLTICTCSTSWCNGQRIITADPVIVFIIVLIISSKHLFSFTGQAA